MSLMTDKERALARTVSRLAYCNPFLPERIECEQQALGPEFVATGLVWHARDESLENPNVTQLNERVEALSKGLRERVARGGRAGSQDLRLYEDLTLYLLYNRYEADFYHVILERKGATRRLGFYPRFAADLNHYLGIPKVVFPTPLEPAQLFAFFFQIRRAFHLIFRNIVGGSMPAARLRASVWQSIFTRDLERYRRSLYDRMHDISTLITGPSGTGKELVAQAIGLARYIPFDPEKQTFTQDFAESFYALNLAALSPTLIESELFGHRRGAFTGAVQDRVGWFEMCPPPGTVFLDEIAEVDISIQVKLLRVLQTRTFQRIGDTRDRRFHGKIIAATNRDLAAEIQTGRFREDLYYRLCSDLIETPSLEEQLQDSPQELRNLLRFIAQRLAGDSEAEPLAGEAERWIEEHLGRDYRWPGNVRELEQCVRNVLVRGEYRPSRPASGSTRDALVEGLLGGSLTVDQLLRRYCTLIYAQTESYQETARRLGLDRRTVKEKIDDELLKHLRAEDSTATKPSRSKASVPSQPTN